MYCNILKIINRDKKNQHIALIYIFILSMPKKFSFI